MYHPVKSLIAWQILSNGFWFVDIPRTSSSSIRIELSTRFGSIYGKSNLLDQDLRRKSRHQHNLLKMAGIGDHSTAQQVRSVIGQKAWDKIYKFTLVRNPWDRMVSLYLYRLKKGRIKPSTSFREYISQLQTPQYCIKHSMHSRPAFYYSACEYVCNEAGGIMVDYVGKFEERQNFIRIVAEAIAFPDFGSLATQQAKPASVHYSNFYDSEAEVIVGHAYAKDIDTFGYQFERRHC